MNSTEKTIVGVFILFSLMLCATFAYFNGNLAFMGLTPAGTGTDDGTGDLPASQYAYNGRGVGTFTMKDTAYNSLDISTALVLATSVDQYWYAQRSGNWALLGPHGASGTTIELTEADGDYIYVMCAPHTTATYVLDKTKTLTMNPRAKSAQFIDITGDGTKEFVVKLLMTNVPGAASGYPEVTFTGFYYYEDSANTTDAAPQDNNVGTALNTTSVEWYVTLAATKRALPFYKIQVKMNSTTLSEAKLTAVQVPTIGLVQESSLEYWYDSSYQYFEYQIGTGHLGDCAFIQIESNQATKAYLTATITTDLGSDAIACTMTIFELSYADGVVVDSDTVNLTPS